MRLVTRPDLDGLACALVMGAHESIDEIALIHPQRITDKEFSIRPTDVLANLPYHSGCARWFDHHLLTPSNEQPPKRFDGLYRPAPSAAQLVWEYYGKDERFTRLIEETNKLDSAQLSVDDVLQPQGYVLLGFTLDAATGLGDTEAYFRFCLDALGREPVERVLAEEAVRARILRMYEENEESCWQLVEVSRLLENVVFTDLRRMGRPPVGNRFLIYTLFPEANVSVRVGWGRARRTAMVKVGHSIFNRTCRTSVGELMSRYGGGGHFGAGSAPLAMEGADAQIFEIIHLLQEQG